MQKEEKEITNYITLSRRVFEGPLWNEDRPKTLFEAWLWLIKEARFEIGQQKLLLGGKLVTWSRGQLPGSVRYLADSWKWSKGKVERFLIKLENEGMIAREIDPNSGQTIISLLNYELYNYRKDSKRDTRRDTKNKDSKALQEIIGTADGTPDGTRAGQRRDNTNIDNKENNGECLGAAAQTHTQSDLESFLKLKSWMEVNTPRVLKMGNPLTVEQFVSLKSKFTKQQIAEMLLKMHNYKPLLKNNISTYLTFINWSKKDFNYETNEQSTNAANEKIKSALRKKP